MTVGTWSGRYGTVAMWIVSPWLVLICGNCRSNALNGMRNQWLFEPPKKPPLSSMTPTTVYFQPFISTTLSSGLSRGKSAFWTSLPMTHTGVACSMSASVRKRPDVDEVVVRQRVVRVRARRPWERSTRVSRYFTFGVVPSKR